jgi:uncharacterized protein (TIGR03083 family)
MDPDDILAAARRGLEAVAGQTADLLCSLPDVDVPIPGSAWTVRDTAAHLVAWTAVYGEMANGMPSPVQLPAGVDGARYRDTLAEESRQRLIDMPETDPAKLARLVLEEAGRFVYTTAGRPGDQPVSFHGGVPTNLAGLVCTCLGEHVVHGYDMATATGVPWPIDPAHAALIHSGWGPLYSLCVNRSAAAGQSVAYEVELRGLGRAVVRFADGEYRAEPSGSGSVDCTVSADPVAYLLVVAGRLSQFSAIALGLLSAGGARPELALRLGNLFIFP